MKEKKEKMEMEFSNKGNLIQRTGEWLYKNSHIVTCVFMVSIMASSMVFATAADAGTMWNAVMELIKTWVIRLGLVVILVGGIMFGLGFKNDSPEQKTQGANTMISGGIVTAVAGLVSHLMV